MSPNPIYSLCMTNYNDADTLRDSITSVLNQVGEEFEVVVVDSMSDDGSFEILQEFGNRIRLVRKKCSRGGGRQLAFEESIGGIVVAGFDMDDIMLPNLRTLVSLYESRYDGKVLRVKRSPVGNRLQFCTITVGTREAISSLGGWRDVQWFEDADFWKRARRAGRLVEITYPITMKSRSHPERTGVLGRAKQSYVAFKAARKLGKPRKVTPKNALLYAIASVMAFFER